MFFYLKKSYYTILLLLTSVILIIKENIQQIEIYEKIKINNLINRIFLILFEIIKKTLDLLIYTFLRITSPINKFIPQKHSEELIYQIIFCLMLYFIYIIFKVVFKKYYKKS